jgi:hypothetical protein
LATSVAAARLSGATRYHITDAAAHKRMFEVALFQFSINDCIMSIRQYRPQAERKG